MKRFSTLSLLLVLWLTVMPGLLRAQMDVLVSVTGGVTDPTVRLRIENSTAQLLSAFNKTIMENKRIKATCKECALPEELSTKIIDMWKTSAIMCPVSEIRERVIQTSGGGYQMRNIPVSLLAATESQDEDDQDLVLSFRSDGTLSNISIALDKHNYNQVILSDISVEDLTRRQIILDFVENFRTAYNRKDIAYLKQVYSDDALIITGTYLKKKNTDNSALIRNIGANDYKMMIQTKEEYINKLQNSVFKKNAYINLKFEEVTVKRHPKYEHIYGVTLKQHWNSSTYSDVGWLFLMINFENEDNPSIEVRTWQPEKFTDGRIVPREEIYSLDNFNI